MNSPLSSLFAHDPCKRALRGLIEVRNLQKLRMDLVSGTHCRNDRDTILLCCLCQQEFGCYGIYRVNHIVIIPKVESSCCLRKEECPIRSYTAVRIDITDAFFCGVNLVAPQRAAYCNDLPIQI